MSNHDSELLYITIEDKYSYISFAFDLSEEKENIVPVSLIENHKTFQKGSPEYNSIIESEAGKVVIEAFKQFASIKIDELYKEEQHDKK